MKYSLKLGLVCICILSSLSTRAQNLDPKALSATIDSLLPESVNDTTPGLVLGVVHKGELVYKKGFGLANVAYSIPNDAKMVYNLGSVSKQFLGYGIAMLHAEGKMNVDDPVSKHLNDWPEFEHGVTVRHLLSHSSGYREAYTISNLAGREIGVDHLSQEECLNVVRKQPKLEFKPGDRFTYNSTGYVILAKVLENVTGKSADIWVEENIIQPLGMKSTRIESFVGEVIPNAAESYYYDDDGYYNPKSNRAIFGAADVYASIEDLALWMDNFRTGKVGGAKAAIHFLTPLELNNRTSSNYAFGIGVNEHNGVRRYSHTGSHEAFLTQLSYYPDYDLGLVTISNFGGDGWFPMHKLAEFILADEMKIEKKEKQDFPEFEANAEDLKSFTGLYMSEEGNETVNVELENDTLIAWSDYKLIPIGPGSFGIVDWSGRIDFQKMGDAPVVMKVVDDEVERYEMLPDWEPSSEYLNGLSGDYWSEEIESVYHVSVKNDTVYTNHRWNGEAAVKVVAKDLLRSENGMIIRITRGKNEKVSGFNVSSGRTQNVFFEKQQ